MDPWPTQRKEPKAPDKNIEALNPKDSNIIMKIKSENTFPACGKNDSYSPRVVASNKDSSVSSLNEPDLKALLEEAMAYKRPKDIQGKSDLFKELLHSVECEKKFTVLSRSEKQTPRKPRRKPLSKKDTEKTSSDGQFQDLIVHVSECDVSTKRQVKYSLKCSPTTVPQVVPVNAVTVCDENNPEVAALLQNGSFENLEQIQQFIANEANVYQIQAKEPVDNRVGFPLTISPYGEKTQEPEEVGKEHPRISVKDIATLTAPPKDTSESSVKENLLDSKKSLDENGNAVGTSRVENLPERKSKTRRLKAKNDKNTILSQHIEGHRSDIAQDIDALMKYIESPKGTDTKSARQRNSVGYSKQGSRIGNKIAPVRDKSSDTFSRKVQKNKEDKLHKSSSLEEVSISKFEDLTQSAASDEKIKVNKKSTIDKNASSIVSSKNEKDLSVSEGSPPHLRIDKTEQEPIDADFLPVTKKNRKKKGVCENNLRNKNSKMGESHRSDKVLNSYIRKSQELDRFHHAPTREFQRRKSISSVPSSDKSGDTSDLDSVHSFPVSSSKGKGMKGNVSVSIGSTPQISYADIARSVPSPTRNDLSPKCKVNVENFVDYEESHYSPQEPIPTVIFQLPPRKETVETSIKSREEYPPLENKTPEKNISQSDLFVEYTVVVPKRNSTHESTCVNVEETVLITLPPAKRDISALESSNLDVNIQLPVKRPPVILMNSSANDSNDVNDLEFGFEVNEQLLSCSETLKNSDLVCNEPKEAQICASSITVDQKNSETSHSENPDDTDDSDSPIYTEEHLRLVEYVSSEWKAVQEELNSGSGKAVYFSP